MRKNGHNLLRLNDNHELFIKEWLANGRNGVQAYMKAYPNANYNTANRNASDLLKDPLVRARIDELTKARYDELNITADHIAQELAEMAFAAKGDEDFSAQIKLKALDLLQKQLGLQSKNVNVESTAAVQIVEDL
jgi:phage terminase small subunit